MIDLLINYSFFLLKVITIVFVLFIPLLIFANANRNKKFGTKGQLVIKNLSDRLENMGFSVLGSQMNPKSFKKLLKETNKKKKKEEKNKEKESIFVLNFYGDMKATGVDKLKEEINAILASKTKCKEVVVKVESGGGSAFAYGLCAAELKRLIDNKISLTICIDKVAASGGYLMSCVATKIIAAPWAVVGSIGVIAQLPNLHRLLKKNAIDIELHTAGKYKRTLTTLGKNTPVGRKKFIKELDELHTVFKDFVKKHRPKIDVKKVATGEVWQGEQAKKIGLIDEISTSDAYLLGLSSKFKLLEVDYYESKPLGKKLGIAVQDVLENTAFRIYEIFNKNRFF